MDFIKQKVNNCNLLRKGCAEIGADGDIIVPDTKPDILKVIQVDGNAVITSKNIENGKFSCIGKLEVRILYVPDAENEKIKSIITSFDFSHVMTGNDITSETMADLSADVSKVDFQLTNSRKLRIKSIIALSYGFMSENAYDIACGADEENMLEIMKKPVCASNFIGFRDTQFLVRESLEIPTGQSSVCELLKVDAVVSDTEYKAINSRVIVKGICDVCALYTNDNGDVKYADFEIPFTEILEMEGINENSICELELNVCDVTYHCENDSDGDTRIIYTEAVISAKYSSYECIDFEYIEDCYCPGRQIVEEKEMKEIECISSSLKTDISIRETLVPSPASPVLTGIYNLIARPVVESVKTDENKICVEGKIVCYCLYLCDGESPVYSSKNEIRFCETVEAEGSKKGMDCRINADVSRKSYCINSSGETELKIVISLNATVTKRVSVPVVSGFDIKDINEAERKGIVIYFTRSDDNLWSVAKKYKVRSEDIIKINKLEDGNFAPGSKLLIPSM